MEFTCYAATPSATILYTVELCLCDPKDCIKYVNKTKFDHLCQIGCPNYAHKWSCPPFAPLFSDIACKWEKIYLVLMHADLEQFAYIKNDYLKVKAANSMLKSRADQFIREMAKQHGGCISTGSCRLCKPCKCKIGMPCAHPNLMAYSFEALGVDVGQLVMTYFQKQLLWYKKKSLPQYTSVVCGILTNDVLSMEYLQSNYRKCITR